ncbi:VWA domain-containing protein [uncultured Treponema sp.]|uniref:VWA domain-containing protein n=1 Tax=uncultured Treponema sp. TaxID=162155 RepID=UPI0025CB7A6A|nr:VWA domain-containing protein [uncultured Treponema sp.]
MIQFETPSAFLLFFAIFLIHVLRHFGIFSKVAFPLIISDWNGKSFVYKDSFSNVVSILSKLLAHAAFIFLVIALANPIIRHQEKVYTSRGTDILFVLDTSPSMAARDISLVNGVTTRLEAAKLGIKTLTSTEKGAAYGLVAMASEAACIVPPTNDLVFFEKRLDSLNIGEFGDGSAIGTGLTTALYHLSSSKAPKKCIVLITDGENNAGSIHPETAANLAAEKNISLYTFGIGTKGTVPIEYTDLKTGKIHSGFYESDFDTRPLEELAAISGGKYFGIESIASLSASLSEISRREESIQTFHYRFSDQNCYDFFLFAAMILFTATLIIKRIFLSEVL